MACTVSVWLGEDQKLTEETFPATPELQSNWNRAQNRILYSWWKTEHWLKQMPCPTRLGIPCHRMVGNPGSAWGWCQGRGLFSKPLTQKYVVAGQFSCCFDAWPSSEPAKPESVTTSNETKNGHVLGPEWIFLSVSEFHSKHCMWQCYLQCWRCT